MYTTDTKRFIRMPSSKQVLHHEADVAILGSGFAGSILALVLDQIGLKVVIIDKVTHPRFAIGESSTPIGNMILRDLAEKYNLPQLSPLVTYGTWRHTYPKLTNGRKRGFSYFHHRLGLPFSPTTNHDNELLVTASTDNERCDTHWLRADVDHFLIREVKNANVLVFENTLIQSLLQHPAQTNKRASGAAWHINGLQNQQQIEIKAKFVVDATGSASLIPNHLNLLDIKEELETHSHAMFSHFEQLPTWHDVSTSLGVNTQDHPYYCDDAAVHHCIDHGWLWTLRFVDNRVSAGCVLDSRHHRMNYSVSPTVAWQTLLQQYPTLDQLFSGAKLANIPGKLYRTGRLQRLWGQAAGNNWALLPHTAGFIDPLHSTGIAHSLSGIERLAQILGAHWESPDLSVHLDAYSSKIIKEIKCIDVLVAGCYPGFAQFELLTSYAMLYFVAAITYEERRMAAYNTQSPFTHDFLCVDEKPLLAVINQSYEKLKKITANQATPSEIQQFKEEVKEAIAPYNTAGLFTPRINNMYEYTAADV